MATRIRTLNEQALGCLRELSRYLTVSSCTAEECLTSALDRMKSDRPELTDVLDRILDAYSTTANGSAP